ncbi:MAG: GAF domain-containing protein [Acidobacteriota bacterium]
MSEALGATSVVTTGSSVDESSPAAIRPETLLDHIDAIAELVIAEPEPSRLLPKLVDCLHTVFDIEIAVIALGGERELDATAVHTVDHDEPVIVQGDLDRLLRLLVGRRRVFGLGGGRSLPEGGEGWVRSLGWRTMLAVPILDHQERPMGVILLADRRDRELRSYDAQLAGTLARQLAVGLERARVIGRLDGWTQGLQALLAFTAEINQPREISLLIRHLVEHAARFLKAEGGLAGLAESHDDTLCMASDAYWHSGVWHRDPRRWRPGEGLAGQLLVSEFPYLTENYVEDPRAETIYAGKLGVTSALSVPLMSSTGQPVGFFELHRVGGVEPFTWQDAAFLESLANTTAVAIENVRLLEQLEIKSRLVRTLSAENVNRLEEERRHIALELHDEAGQALVGIKLGLKVLAGSATDSSAFEAQLAALHEQLSLATEKIKCLAQRLRPPTLDRLGLDMALQQLVDDYADRTGLVAELSLSTTPERQPPEVETALFRIAQEALTNVVNHAAASRVEVIFEADVERVLLTVSDNGRGFERDAVTRGLGLLGMNERVTMLGGEFEVDTTPGRGTTISVVVPPVIGGPKVSS